MKRVCAIVLGAGGSKAPRKPTNGGQGRSGSKGWIGSAILGRMIFQGPDGPLFYIRSEKRDQPQGPPKLEYFFVSVKDGTLWYKWLDKMPDEYPVIDDQGGRAEAKLFQGVAEAIKQEREALLKCLKAAIAMLDDRAADEIRNLYKQILEKATFSVDP